MEIMVALLASILFTTMYNNFNYYAKKTIKMTPFSIILTVRRYKIGRKVKPKM
jgi:hypothetical protein